MNEAGVQRGDASERPGSYAVEYRGANHDDAQLKFELDQPRRAVDGYVPTATDWIEPGWSIGSFITALWQALPYEWFWRYWRGPPATLVVTYTREDELSDD